jgi:hypothetical protein
MMNIRRALALALFIVLALPAAAEDVRVTLGFGRLFTNDRLGDGQDRWRTGSWSLSAVSGFGWDGQRSSRFGDIVELRFRTEIIAPGVQYGPGSDDRPYAGSRTYGMHTHWAGWGGEMSAGLDVTMVGPQTGIAETQNRLHDWLSVPQLSDEVIEGQIGDGLHPSVTLEYGRPVRLSGTALLRPFVEVQAGVEQIARVGADVILGRVGQGDLMLRDNPSGHLYRVTKEGVTGVSFIAGADWAYVGDSLWLPDAGGAGPLDHRWRARAGAFVQMTERSDLFAGLTWLSPEFTGQPEGQLVGSISLGLWF